MISKNTPTVAFWVLLIGAGVGMTPRAAMAQAPSGPIGPPQSQSDSEPRTQPVQPAPKPKAPVVPPRTTLAGAWRFNHDDSDDPQQRVRVAEQSSGGNSRGYPGGGYPGGYPGGGYPGGYPGGPGGYPGGYPGGGYPGGGRGQRNAEDIADNPQMQPLIHPGDSLNIDLKNPEVDITDDQFRKLTVYTDGRKLQKSKDDNSREVAAHWNGTQLVTDEKSPLGGKMSRTFELSADGRQLYENLHIDNGRSKTPLTIRYVYNAANSAIQPVEQDPDRPVLKRQPDNTDDAPQ